MKLILRFLLCLSAISVFGLSLAAHPAYAYDIRVLKVHKFLSDQDSFLANFASDFVAEADHNGLDYRLLVAITGVESSFGKNYLEGTYNVYGWGSGQIPFTSWVGGITKVSNELKFKYVRRGADTLEKIARIYCPPNSAHWQSSVSYFMDRIDQTDVQSYFPQSPDTQSRLPLTI